MLQFQPLLSRHRSPANAGARPGACRRQVGISLFFATAICLLSVLALGGVRADPIPALITGGADHAIKRWDAAAMPVGSIGTLDSAVVGLALSGDRLYALGADGALTAWNLGLIPSQAWKVNVSAAGSSALALVPGGKQLITGSTDGMIRLLDAASGKKTWEARAHNEAVRGIAFSSDGMAMVTAGADKLLRIWRLNQGSLDFSSNILAHDDAVTGAAFSPDDSLIASVSMDGYLKTWRRIGGGLVNRSRVCDRGVACLTFSPDGRTIATGDSDGKIRLWNTRSGASSGVIGTHDHAVLVLAYSADGMTLISGSEDGTVKVWSVDKGRQAARLAAHDGAVRALVIAP